jgi:ribosomal protein S18 acetylase RimI-like enzyme
MASSDSQKPSSRHMFLRTAAANESEFLIRAYASTRAEEMAAWGWNPAQQASFIQMQFHARRRGYAASYPSADTSVIFLNDVPVGSLTTFRGAREIRLLDISLLAEYRGQGIGGELIGILISEATSVKSAVRLSVVRGNRAVGLYERLGFVATGGDAVYCEMEYLPR